VATRATVGDGTVPEWAVQSELSGEFKELRSGEAMLA